VNYDVLWWLAGYIAILLVVFGISCLILFIGTLAKEAWRDAREHSRTGD
jgi:hypothetical protein